MALLVSSALPPSTSGSKKEKIREEVAQLFSSLPRFRFLFCVLGLFRVLPLLPLLLSSIFLSLLPFDSGNACCCFGFTIRVKVYYFYYSAGQNKIKT